MISRKICSLILFLIISISVSAQTYQTDNGHAEFTGHTPIFSFEGSSGSLQGSIDLDESAVRFRLPVKTIDTGNDRRDRDMRAILEAKKYPHAKFKGKIISSFNPDESSKQKVTVKGTFTVHGTSQNLKIPGTMQFKDKQLNISASWTTKLTDYSMEPPSVSFYSMDDQIEVRVKASLKPNKPSN